MSLRNCFIRLKDIYKMLQNIIIVWFSAIFHFTSSYLARWTNAIPSSQTTHCHLQHAFPLSTPSCSHSLSHSTSSCSSTYRRQTSGTSNITHLRHTQQSTHSTCELFQRWQQTIVHIHPKYIRHWSTTHTHHVRWEKQSSSLQSSTRSCLSMSSSPSQRSVSQWFSSWQRCNHLQLSSCSFWLSIDGYLSQWSSSSIHDRTPADRWSYYFALPWL